MEKWRYLSLCLEKLYVLIVTWYWRQLYISDFGLNSNNAKVAGMVSLVKELNANETLVDGIGVQAHLAVRSIS